MNSLKIFLSEIKIIQALIFLLDCKYGGAGTCAYSVFKFPLHYGRRNTAIITLFIAIGAIVWDYQYLEGIATRICYALLFIDHCAFSLYVQKIKTNKLCRVCGVNRKPPFVTLKRNECTCVCKECARKLRICFICRPVVCKYSIVYTPVCLVILQFLHTGINFLEFRFESGNEGYNVNDLLLWCLALFDVVVVILEAIIHPLLLISSATMFLFIVYRDCTVDFSLFSWAKTLVSKIYLRPRGFLSLKCHFQICF